MKDKKQLLNEYEEYLKNQTLLSDTSIILYKKYIKDLLKQKENLTQKNLIKYISLKKKAGHSNVMKYAIKHFLTMLGKKDIYDNIPRLKPAERLKMSRQYKPEQVIKAINSIDNQTYKDIARIQFVTGRRAREIITLKEENIDLNFVNTYESPIDGTKITKKEISAKITAKGTYTKYIFMPIELESILRRYMRGFKGYLFLDRARKYDNNLQFERKLDSVRRMYHEHLRQAMQDQGIKGFGTHDLRRIFATNLLQQGAPITDVRDLLGHKSIQTTEIYLPKHRGESFYYLHKFQNRLIKPKNEKTPSPSQ